MSEISLIWDVDGTLADSYDSIVDSVLRTLAAYDLHYEEPFIRDVIQKISTTAFFELAEKEHNINQGELMNTYQNKGVIYSLIKPMPHLKQMLEELDKRGVKNYIYTHRGNSTFKVLEELKIEKYFIEVVNRESGFLRKPSPEAIDYLVNKYKMDKEHTYYIGDRLIDQQCARNAGINSIYYQSYFGDKVDSKEYDYYAKDLIEILDIIK